MNVQFHACLTYSVLTWQGRYCQTPTDCAGSLDASGECCTAELSADGMCCAAVDADMACCVSGELDAFGACLGAATSIDLQGAPCQVRACAVHHNLCTRPASLLAMQSVCSTNCIP